jgi:CheY-like chemotaxis protein
MRKAVLIVDDNAFVRRALQKLLTRELAVEVREAQNGKQAIDKAGGLRPDLIVLDISMPLMNRREATRATKSLLPGMRIADFHVLSPRGVHNHSPTPGFCF